MKKIVKVATVFAVISMLSGCIIDRGHGGGWHHGGGHGWHHYR
ncbi:MULTISPECIES: hypothetical protein [Pantoea]|uniref:Lipoprotein n=1 Tax=Pantoea piersonii TaxID=2364647 RepID=A0AAJ5UAQ3_9GAMM|nr:MULTISPECIES: hypothetical protein [Pantoea]MDU6433494.1 hypothetical protein [Pantoea sp.]WBG91909.1 hypothetical protein N5580_05005 [Pantoea piersonii]WBV22576.1 hypothetical protein PG877_05300 [Pantoea piersonii]